MTEQGGQPEDEEELGDGVLDSRSSAALEEHAVVSICAVLRKIPVFVD